MENHTVEISKEEYEKAKKNGAESIVTNPAILYGYGLYGASVSEVGGKYYLHYTCGSSCD